MTTYKIVRNIVKILASPCLCKITWWIIVGLSLWHCSSLSPIYARSHGSLDKEYSTVICLQLNYWFWLFSNTISTAEVTWYQAKSIRVQRIWMEQQRVNDTITNLEATYNQKKCILVMWWEEKFINIILTSYFTLL